MKVSGSISWKKIVLPICLGFSLTIASGLGGMTKTASANVMNPQVISLSGFYPFAAFYISDNQPCKGILSHWTNPQNGRWKIRKVGSQLKLDCRLGRTSVSVERTNRLFSTCSVLTPQGNRFSGVIDPGISGVKLCEET